jgi:hypothetical protein
VERIVQYGEERLREKRAPLPPMASPQEVDEVLARAKRILAQKLLEMLTTSKRIHWVP